MNSIIHNRINAGRFRLILSGTILLCLLVVAACSKSAPAANSTNQAVTQSTAPAAKTNQGETQLAQNIMPTVDPQNSQGVGDPPPAANDAAQSETVKQSYTQADQAQYVVGIWRYQVQSNGYTCQGEDIYQGNGSYSTQWNCSGSVTWQTGVWYLVQPGVIRREIKNYEPKEFRGQPIRMISAETVQFRFLDYNRMQYINGVILYRQ